MLFPPLYDLCAFLRSLFIARIWLSLVMRPFQFPFENSSSKQITIEYRIPTFTMQAQRKREGRQEKKQLKWLMWFNSGYSQNWICPLPNEDISVVTFRVTQFTHLNICTNYLPILTWIGARGFQPACTVSGQWCFDVTVVGIAPKCSIAEHVGCVNLINASSHKTHCASLATHAFLEQTIRKDLFWCVSDKSSSRSFCANFVSTKTFSPIFVFASVYLYLFTERNIDLAIDWLQHKRSSGLFPVFHHDRCACSCYFYLDLSYFQGHCARKSILSHLCRGGGGGDKYPNVQAIILPIILVSESQLSLLPHCNRGAFFRFFRLPPIKCKGTCRRFGVASTSWFR